MRLTVIDFLDLFLFEREHFLARSLLEYVYKVSK